MTTNSQSVQAPDYLAGYRVLDFTQYLAGPSCTRLLAEMGAEVIKVEIAAARRPDPGQLTPAGPSLRRLRPAEPGQAEPLRRPATAEGRAVVMELIPAVDVVVENFSPGVMARRGLDYDVALRHQPPPGDGLGLRLRPDRAAVAARPSFDFIAQAILRGSCT